MSVNMIELPYGPYDLEPYIDGKTMVVHYSQYYGKYVRDLNEILEKFRQFEGMSPKEIANAKINIPKADSDRMRHYAGGVYNHEMYFLGMAPNNSGTANVPHGQLGEAINRQYGSWGQLQQLMREAAGSVHGSGYMYLVTEGDGVLRINLTENQNVPPLGAVSPVLAADLWEHAYYENHKSRRDNYIDDWFEVIDWDRAERLYLDGQ